MSAPSPLRIKLPSPLSVRRSVQLALLALIVIAALQLFLNQQAMTAATIMLQRAEISYRQLDSYRQLSIEILEFLEAGHGEMAPALRRALADRLAALQRSVSAEDQLIRDKGGVENDISEGSRVEQIKMLVEEMLSSGASDVKAIRTYRDRLKPILDDAIHDEQTETALVDQSMRDRRKAMQWLGWLGISAQIAMVAIVLVVIGRAVLDPLNRLVLDIGEFGRGHLTHRIAVLRHDEFGLLAQHINRMAGHLDHRDRALAEINKSLEQTVAERTAELASRNAELEEIDASRRRFFIDVSHELRTPLTAILGEADVTLRARNSSSSTCIAALRSILANGGYLNRRVDDLLALARSSNGQLSLEMSTLDLNLVAIEAQEEISSLAKINQVDVGFEPLSQPVNIRGDRFRIRQCLMILLDNAVKFSPAFQPVDIVISANCETASMSVVDHGRGIPADELPTVFERFYQTEVGRRRGGTGLGLAIARRIIEAHEGSIVAANIDGGGTSITFTLPITKGADA